ncbi:Cof-type HAD-IIB family hydrolase [Companilactobacillus insicii]|uniref:Cof-type HAD-IIB family hydrolase n=1 Tax=Companilactobacillus insicii TaxID=1732567 RepID=UPI000F76A260|nr:Cof-type HAD-IIB family hydrolase [Companilactobacillus insicii]
MIKLIGTDLDGTLLDSYSRISPENVESIRQAVASGLVYSACSGRTLYSVNKFFKNDLKVPGYKVVLNGAVVINPEGDRVINAPLSHDLIEEILKRSEFSNFKIVLDGLDYTQVYDPTRNWTTYFEGNSRHNLHASSINELREKNDDPNFDIYKICFSASPDRLPELQKKLESFTSLPVTISRSGNDYFEINAQDITKLSALQRISELESIPISQFMCFGDYGNDYDMIREVGYGVAMGNAIEKVKDVAWKVSKSNNENGVAVVIKQVLDGYFDGSAGKSDLDI